MDERSMEGWMVLCGPDNFAHASFNIDQKQHQCNFAQPLSDTEESSPAYDMTERK